MLKKNPLNGRADIVKGKIHEQEYLRKFCSLQFREMKRSKL